MRTIGQAFDVVHRIVEAEKDQNNNLDNLDKDEIEKEIVFSPRKSIKSNKVRSTVRDVSSLRVLYPQIIFDIRFIVLRLYQ